MTPRRPSIVFALAAVVLFVVAACGSGSDTSSSDKATSAAVKEMEQDPTTIPLTTPLPEKPKPGGTIAFLKCAVPQCQQLSDGLKAATKAVGWKVVDIPFVDSDPGALAPAFHQALAAKPAAVVLTGQPYELWSRYIPEVQKIGAIIAPMYTGPATLSDTVPAVAAGPANDKALAASIARWVTDDSGGKAHVLVQRISAYKAVTGWADGAKTALADICPNCKVSEINSSADEITGAGAAQAIVSAARRDPSINYFIGYCGCFFQGLNQQLANAQLKVKVGGGFPLPQNVQDEQRGSGGAFIAANNPYASWLAVDTVLRHAQGAPMVPLAQQVSPAKLITRASATDPKSDSNYQGPEGYEAQFQKLWKVN